MVLNCSLPQTLITEIQKNTSIITYGYITLRGVFFFIYKSAGAIPYLLVIIWKYEELIKCATEVSSSVVVSSICHSSRGDAVLDRIRALNAGLNVACDGLCVEFVDNDSSFHLQDGTVNDGYLLLDGVHFSRAATNKLINNPKLQLRHGETSAHHHVNRHWRLAPQQAKDSRVLPDSDDGDLQHAIWQRVHQKGNERKHPGQQAHVFRQQVTHNVTGSQLAEPWTRRVMPAQFPLLPRLMDMQLSCNPP